MGGLPILLELVFDNQDKESKLLACLIVAQGVQNSAFNQRALIESGGFSLINLYLSEKDPEI